MELEQRNQAQAGYIRQLEEALKNARHWRFGRKSEAFQGEQRGLFDEDIKADAADIKQQLATLLPEPKAPKPQVAKRQLLPRLHINGFHDEKNVFRC